jgi:hypothetical protein
MLDTVFLEGETLERHDFAVDPGLDIGRGTGRREANPTR